MREEIVNLTISANEDSLAYPPQLDAKLAYLAMDVGTADSAPTEAEQREFEKLKRQSGELSAAGTICRGAIWRRSRSSLRKAACQRLLFLRQGGLRKKTFRRIDC